MKKAKEKFDALVQKARSGEQVSFGEMEKVFAEGFLDRFLKRLTSGSERGRTQDLYKQYLADEGYDYHEDDEGNILNQDQLTHYELEVARLVVGTLGVRPGRAELSDYVDRALRNQDWSLLDKVLSLTQEGSLGEGIVEKLALEAIVEGRDETYSGIRQQFNDLKFTPEQVVPVYERELAEKRFDIVENLRNETKVAVPADLAQSSYERFLNEGDISSMVAVRDISRVQPNLTTDTRITLGRLFETRDLSQHDVEGVDALYGLSSNDSLSRSLQLKALDNKTSIAPFIYLYKRARLKIDQDVIKRAYDKLAEEDRLDDLQSVMMSTGVPGSKTVTSVLYNNYITKGSLGAIRELFDRTNVAPQYDMEVITGALDKIKRTTGTRYPLVIGKFLEAIQLQARFNRANANTIGKKILEDSLDLPALVPDETSEEWKKIPAVVDDFFAKYEMEQPDEIIPLQIYHAIKSLNRDIYITENKNRKTIDHRRISPMEVIEGENISLYNKFRGSVRSLTREYISRVKKLRKKREKVTITDNAIIQKAYERCLELALVEAQQGEKSIFPLAEMQEVTGVQISPETTRQALDQFVEKNYALTDPATVSIVNTTSLGVFLSDDAVENLLENYARDNDITKKARKVALVTQVSGKRSFSDNVKPVLTKVVADALVEDVKLYDIFSSIEGLKPEFNPIDRETIKHGAIKKLTKGEFEDYDGIIQRSGVNIQVTQQRLNEIVEAYFRDPNPQFSPMNTSPNEISKRLGLPLDEAQIQARYAYLSESSDSYLRGQGIGGRFELIKRLKDNTGINPNDDLVRRAVKSNEGNLLFLEQACKEFGFRYTNEEIERLYDKLIPHIEKNYRDADLTRDITNVPAIYLHTLMRTHNHPPDEKKAQQIIEKTVERELEYSSGDFLRERLEALTTDLVSRYGIRAQDSAVEKLVKTSLQSPGQKNTQLIDRLYSLENVYRRGDILSTDDARSAVTLIDVEFRIKTQDQNRRGTLIRDLSYVYQRANAQQEAAELAANLLQQGPIHTTFAGYAYCAITGIKPNMSREQIARLREGFKDTNRFAYIFTNEQRDHYQKIVDSWLEAV